VPDTVAQPAPLVLPQPDQISEREKEDAMGAYLMMFAAWGLGLPLPLLNLLAAVIYHMVNRKKSPFVAFHSLQSLLTQVMVSLLNAGLIAWTVMFGRVLVEVGAIHFPLPVDLPRVFLPVPLQQPEPAEALIPAPGPASTWR